MRMQLKNLYPDFSLDIIFEGTELEETEVELKVFKQSKEIFSKRCFDTFFVSGQNQFQNCNFILPQIFELRSGLKRRRRIDFKMPNFTVLKSVIQRVGLALVEWNYNARISFMNLSINSFDSIAKIHRPATTLIDISKKENSRKTRVQETVNLVRL